MAEFVIKLADERGRVQEQMQSAATAEELRARFCAGRLLCLLGQGARAHRPIGKRKKVKLETFLIFNQQFLTLIRPACRSWLARPAGQAPEESALLRRSSKTSPRACKTGESLSAAFDAQGGFPLIYTTTLLAGERSGNLEEVLQRYLVFQRISLTFRKKLKASLIYPVLLITLVDRPVHLPDHLRGAAFRHALRPGGHQAAGDHVFLLALGNAAQNYGPLRPARLCCSSASGLYRWSKTDSGASAIDKIRLAVPALRHHLAEVPGRAVRSHALPRCCTGGLPLVPSLETAARSISSSSIANAVFTSVTQRARRQGAVHSQSEATRIFPELAIEMIEVGESTGALPPMLNSVAEFL